jgi:hypothetical protein
VETVATPVCLILRSLLMGARWARERRRLCLQQAAEDTDELGRLRAAHLRQQDIIEMQADRSRRSSGARKRRTSDGRTPWLSGAILCGALSTTVLPVASFPSVWVLLDQPCGGGCAEPRAASGSVGSGAGLPLRGPPRPWCGGCLMRNGGLTQDCNIWYTACCSGLNSERTRRRRPHGGARQGNHSPSELLCPPPACVGLSPRCGRLRAPGAGGSGSA